jgi:hypothetical protein
MMLAVICNTPAPADGNPMHLSHDIDANRGQTALLNWFGSETL